jgi:general L-amino acid transport system substrate-binding protein
MSKRLTFLGASLLIIAIIYSACAAPAAAPAATPAPVEASAAAPAADAAAAPAAQAGSRLDVVKERGRLICGVNNQLPGFGIVDATGAYAGFDVDFCKAVAAAVLGDANAVDYKYASSNDRFTLVKTGEVDVLFRNSTWTTTRDSAEVGMEFMPVNFYDGQGMMVRADSGIASIEDMDGATVCVQSGTTTELNLADYFRARGLDFTPVVFEDNDKTLAAYDEGRCDGFTTDKSGLVSSLTKMQVPADHIILEDTMSKEPLAGAVSQGDAVWADAVRWVVYGLIQAEESGVTAPTCRRCWRAKTRTSSVCSASKATWAPSSACPTTTWSRRSSRSATTAKSGTATSARTRPSSWRAASTPSGPTAVCSTRRPSAREHERVRG